MFQSETGSENNVALTAYVLISLIESGLPIQKKVIDNAKYCLRGYSSTDKYTISIISYALALVKWEDEALRSLERLLEIGTRKNGLLSWEDPGCFILIFYFFTGRVNGFCFRLFIKKFRNYVVHGVVLG